VIFEDVLWAWHFRVVRSLPTRSSLQHTGGFFRVSTDPPSRMATGLVSKQLSADNAAHKKVNRASQQKKNCGVQELYRPEL
jgi:hypothetical protein